MNKYNPLSKSRPGLRPIKPSDIKPRNPVADNRDASTIMQLVYTYTAPQIAKLYLDVKRELEALQDEHK